METMIGQAQFSLAGAIALAGVLAALLLGVKCFALSADAPQIVETGDFNDIPVKASSTIYRGSMVGLTSGYARALTAGDTFMGHAEAGAVGGASDGTVRVRVRQGHYRLQVTLASVAVTDVGKNVYASADDTYTLTQSTNSPVGKVVRYVTTNTCIVEFRAPFNSQTTAALTTISHTSPGTPDYAIANVTNSTPFGFTTADEANTVLSVIRNLQLRLAELEARI